MELPYEMSLYLRHPDGRRETCSFCVSRAEKDKDGMYNVELTCPTFLVRPLRTNGDSREEAASYAFQFIRSLIRNLELTCEDEAGRPVTLPSGRDIDPSYPSEEELMEAVRRAREESEER